MYVRGHQEDYDRWAEAGCRGWSYEEVMPYFLKAESNRNSKFAKTRRSPTLVIGIRLMLKVYYSPTLGIFSIHYFD